MKRRSGSGLDRKIFRIGDCQLAGWPRILSFERVFSIQKQQVMSFQPRLVATFCPQTERKLDHHLLKYIFHAIQSAKLTSKQLSW